MIDEILSKYFLSTLENTREKIERKRMYYIVIKSIETNNIEKPNY